MKKNIHLLLILLLGLLSSFGLFAQQIVPTIIGANGNSQQFANGQLDWTVGEVAVSPLTSKSVFVTQGFHQPVLQEVGLDNENQIQISISPIPTFNNFTVTIESDLVIDVSYTLYDYRGRLLSRDMNNGQEIVFTKSMSSLPAATYMLVLAFSNGRSETYKIQKITY